MAFKLLLLPAIATLVLLHVNAENTSNATCTDSYSWMNNAIGQNPCVVAASLTDPCFTSKSYTITPLSEHTRYSPSSSSNLCTCNTVFYSMLAACATCQPDHSNGLGILRWSDWIENCADSDIRVKTYPESVPSRTEVPSWAYLDLTPAGRFDVVAAQSLAQAPPSSASGISSSASSSSPTTTSSGTVSVSQGQSAQTASQSSGTVSASQGQTVGTVPPLSSPVPAFPGQTTGTASPSSVTVFTSSGTVPTSKGQSAMMSSLSSATAQTSAPVSGSSSKARKLDVGAIVGGVVGGTIGVLVLIGVCWVLLKRRRVRGQKDHDMTDTSRDDSSLGSTEKARASREIAGNPRAEDVGTKTVFIRYNPDDPRTFPPQTDWEANDSAEQAPTGIVPNSLEEDHATRVAEPGATPNGNLVPMRLPELGD